MASYPKHLCTPEEYIALERKALYKNEYCNGEISAMPGASREHILIVVNLGSDLNTQLENRDCEVYTTEMRVRTPDTKLYTYPDVAVVCGPPKFEDQSVDTLLNPTLIVEVLSPSTEAYDRTKKFSAYRTINSLQEYILTSQQECRVTQFIRPASGPWLFQEFTNLEDTIHFQSIKCSVSLKKIYARIQFPPDSELQASEENRL